MRGNQSPTKFPNLWQANLPQGLTNIGSAISELIYPAICIICDKRYSSGRYSVCPYCWGQMLKKRQRPIITKTSLSNKKRAAYPSIRPQASEPQISPIPTIYLGTYCSPLSEMLQKFKYEGFLSLGERLALTLVRLRARQIQALGADVLIPIPLHITGFKARGFNQALVISDILNRLTGLPVATNMVEKIVKTKNQANLSTEHRQSNLAGAFIAHGSEFSGKRVIIVDDVMTTGSTIAEVGKTIEQAGIKVVGAVALASAIDCCTISKPAQ